MDAGVAVRLPRGAHPARRRPHRLRDRRALVRRSCASAPDTIKAYPNACLHRGRQLKQYDGNCSEIRCPFHGFAWHLDGSLKDVPAALGPAPRHRRTASPCRRSRSARGTGSCSSTPTPTPSRWRTSSGSWPPHFDRWNLRDRYVQAHVSKVIRANWKIAQEAFCEAFHVNATHPQILPYIGDTNSQVDVWENCSRVITPAATPSPLLDWTPDEETILRYALDVRLDEELFITVKEGQTARSAMADATRDRWRPVVGELDRRVVRRRDGRQPRLHAVPELPPVGRVQPHRLPLPAERRRPPLVDHGGAVPRPVQGRAAAARRRCTTSASTSRGPTPPSSGCSARCSSRTRSTWRACSSGWRPPASPA